MTPHRAILRTASLIVPRRGRAEWLADWQAELWYVPRERRLRFSVGAFQDAVWVRRSQPRATVWLESPGTCVALLSFLAAASLFSFLRWPPVLKGALLVHVLMLAISLAILPATLPLTFGEYPRAGRIKRWAFAGLKMLLVLTIVFCGIRGLQPHATLVGYVVGFRWALRDQRKRCPVCLRRLANPIRIGLPSQTFLEWYGTELFCTRGHGMMHVPEITVSHSAPRWHDLDPSWRSLFL